MSFNEKAIIVTSNEPWGDLWYSKQNYAYELSKTHQVIFINPPQKWKVKNLLLPHFYLEEYTANLRILNYQNTLPIINNFFNRINNYIISKRIKFYLKRNGFTDYILWAFDPQRLYNHKVLGAVFGVYHCVDYYYFKFIGETELCKNSDVLFATSQRYIDEYKDFQIPKYIVPHGISSEEFEINPEESLKAVLPVEDYALYVGVIDRRIDYELLEKALIRFPELPFVFIGPVRIPNDSISAKRIFEDKKYKNLLAIGSKHFKTLKYYINKARFCISFMDMKMHSNTVHHHKTLVYLTQGKPIFSPTFTEYKDLSNIIYLNDSYEGLLNMIDKFLKEGEDKSLSKKRMEYAKRFTFEQVLEDATNILNKYCNSNQTT